MWKKTSLVQSRSRFGHGTFVLGLFQLCVTKGNAQKIQIDKYISFKLCSRTSEEHSRVCKHNASLCDIFNGEFGFSSLPRYSSNGSG